MNYEALLIEADSHQLEVKEKNLIANDGRIKGRKIAIRKDIETTVEKSCVLAEELGHHYTSSGDIIDMQDVMNQKQEYRARLWAFNKQIGLTGLIRAFEAGRRSRYEIADFLEVTESFLAQAIKCYTSKYGTCVSVDNYLIYFSPVFGVSKIF